MLYRYIGSIRGGQARHRGVRRTKVADGPYIYFHREQQSVVVIYYYDYTCTRCNNNSNNNSHNNSNNNRNHKTWLLRINSSGPQAEQAKGAGVVSARGNSRCIVLSLYDVLFGFVTLSTQSMVIFFLSRPSIRFPPSVKVPFFPPFYYSSLSPQTDPRSLPVSPLFFPSPSFYFHPTAFLCFQPHCLSL